MAYHSGSIVNADPSAAFIAAIEAGFDAHDNWDFVEEVTISTVAYRVWKNRGTGSGANSFGTDFHVMLSKLGTTAFTVKAFEAYTASGGTPANAKMIRPCINGANNAYTMNANGSYGDETNGFGLDNINAPIRYVGFTGLTTTGFEYQIQVNKDGLYVSIKQSTSDATFYAGLFESVLTSSPAEPMPLFIWNGSSTLSNNNFGTQTTYGFAAVSRHPGISTASGTFRGSFDVTITSELIGPRAGGVGSTEADLFHGGSVLAAAPAVATTVGSASRHTHGWFRGRCRNLLSLAAFGGTTRNGDTLTLGSDVYVAMVYPNNLRGWVKRDAA